MNAAAVVIWDPITKWPYVLIFATKPIAKARRLLCNWAVYEWLRLTSCLIWGTACPPAGDPCSALLCRPRSLLQGEEVVVSYGADYWRIVAQSLQKQQAAYYAKVGASCATFVTAQSSFSASTCSRAAQSWPVVYRSICGQLTGCSWSPAADPGAVQEDAG